LQGRGVGDDRFFIGNEILLIEINESLFCEEREIRIVAGVSILVTRMEREF
jgi:hypothetical protein